MPKVTEETRANDDNTSVTEELSWWNIEDSLLQSRRKSQPDTHRDEIDFGFDFDRDDDPYIRYNDEYVGANEYDDINSTSLAGYTGLRAFLLESEEYHWLLRRLELVKDHGNESESWLHVHNQIIKSLAALPGRVGTSRWMSLSLPWQPKEFMHQQYGNTDVVARLGDVITISGSLDNAFASTCEAYILRTWPRHGPFVLESIESAISSAQQSLQAVANDFSLVVSFYADCTTIVIVGDPMFLAESAEIIVWLSTACRASTAPDRIQIGRMDLAQVLDYKNDLSFVARLIQEDDGANGLVSRATCWHGIFRNPFIARGYPIPSRKAQESGLELSIDLMLTLAQAFHSVVYCGVLLLKGFSTLLAPTKKEAGSVSWHFMFNQAGARQTYNDGLEHSRLRHLDDAIFDGARHFVGWSQSAEFLVGQYSFSIAKGTNRNSLTNMRSV